MILKIETPQGAEIIRADIGDRDPNKVTIAVLEAIDKVSKRKTRCDAGKPRVAGKGESADAQE